MEFTTFYENYSTQLNVIINALIASLLGAIIGFERELKRRPAGMRTHLLVAVSATLFINLAQLLADSATATDSSASIVNFDPSRALVAIVTGISFLGAGTIFRSEDGVEGLTTAATLLFAAAVGITVALGEHFLALVLTFLNVTSLRVLGALEKRITK